jgi:hypothetical protein
MVINGSCFCGSITYQVNGALHDARSCHCSRCRKAFSSQASAYAEIEPGSFEWVSGEEKLVSYESKNGGGLKFCSTCGSTLCGTANGEIHGVTLGCIDGDPGVSIGMHIFVGSKAPWEVMPKGVLMYDERPTT